jgi:hypothetical protein
MSDFQITDQLLACAVRDHNVDPRRVFTTGCSGGGLFAAAMAAARSGYIAAAASNSGGWTTPVQFQNDHTPALMTIHGAPGSDLVIVEFSETSLTADRAFTERGGFVINCNHGGGHCGGGGFAADVWEFFKAHPYGVEPAPWAGRVQQRVPDLLSSISRSRPWAGCARVDHAFVAPLRFRRGCVQTRAGAMLVSMSASARERRHFEAIRKAKDAERVERLREALEKHPVERMR